MMFSELYSAYYNAVAGVLSDIINGETDETTLQEKIDKYAFSESVLTILPSLKSEKWQLVKSDMTTPVKNIPTMPVTLLQKRWLKAISMDPRIRLFDISFEGLEDVEPLFVQEDYFIYDRYADGDPYMDEEYIRHFKTVLRAIKEKKYMQIETVNRNGKVVRINIFPMRIEYSQKDDKFRLISVGRRSGSTVNIARIVDCRICGGESAECEEKIYLKQRTLTLKILDERNALERVMLHFAHFEKRAEKIDDNNYILHITYDVDDETEIVIRILSFGPMVEVIEPDGFRELIIERLKKQKSYDI